MIKTRFKKSQFNPTARKAGGNLKGVHVLRASRHPIKEVVFLFLRIIILHNVLFVKRINVCFHIIFKKIFFAVKKYVLHFRPDYGIIR